MRALLCGFGFHRRWVFVAAPTRHESFRHTDLDGNELLVTGGDESAVFFGYDYNGSDNTGVAVHADKLPDLIKCLTTIHARITEEA